MSSPYILKYGSEALKAKYLPGIISGDLISCISITEPGAGSDVQNIQTITTKEGEHYKSMALRHLSQMASMAILLLLLLKQILKLVPRV
ncbi:MAG: hypothetical protein ACI9FN_002459 [Saprospiraceae bacterium]|jgi:hypothetical protein